MRASQVLAGAALVALGAIAGCWWGRSTSEEPAAAPPSASAPPETRVAPRRRSRAEETPAPISETSSTSVVVARGSDSEDDAASSVGARRTQEPVPTRLAEATADPDRGALRVIVTDDAGRPREGAQVIVADAAHPNGVGNSETRTAADGRAEFPSVAPGTAQVMIGVSQRVRTLSIEVEAGRWTEVPFAIGTTGVVVEGTLRHAERGPLAGVGVYGLRRADGPSDNLHTTTDERGAWRFDAAPPGTWEISVAGPGVGFNQRQRAELVVPETGSVRCDLVIGVESLRGVVRDAVSRRPIAGVDVQVQEPVFEMTTTDADGVYRFRDLVAGDYKLFVARDGFEALFLQSGAVKAGELRTLDVDLRPAATLVLRIADERGAPVAGQIQLTISNAATPKECLGTGAVADADGVARYARIAPGEYEIGVHAEGFVSPAKATHAVVVPGENRLAFTLAREPRNAAAVTSLRGTIRDAATGAPIAGVTVHVQLPSWKDAVTDAAGAFEIADLGTGRLEAFLQRDGYGLKVLKGLDLVAGTPLVLDEKLDAAATLHVRVTDRQGRVVAGRLTLSVRPLDAAAGGTSVGTGIVADETGLATFRQIVPGRYRLRVATYEGEHGQVDADVGTGETTVIVRFE